uniref:G_PROTEIN_RECEP_F1_2 domain-containing protein n=1 Tax=Heterorhabditis bacteriophora TaxID=37862 RepID=A0A1I7X6Z7_HETBA
MIAVTQLLVGTLDPNECHYAFAPIYGSYNQLIHKKAGLYTMMRCHDDPPLFNLEDNSTMTFFENLTAFNDRRPMRAYIINALLCAMAVCDALTMVSYLIYILRFRIFDNDSGVFGYSYPWLVFLIVHVTSSIALHTGSLYLSVAMAYIRWTALDRLDAKWINHGAIRHIFFFTAFSVTVISIPTLMVHKIVSVSEVLGSNETEFENLYTVKLDETDINGCTMFRANLWITGIMFKAVPCALLLWFTIALIVKLCEMSEKRRLLRGDNNNNSNSNKYNTTNNSKKCNKLSIDKTTLMLIIMLVVFLCTELPQGLLAVLSAIYPTHVHTMVYVNVGEVLDLLSLVNCLTSFVLYCFMSSTYRNTVKSIFCTNNRKSSVRKNTQAMQSLRLLLP